MRARAANVTSFDENLEEEAGTTIELSAIARTTISNGDILGYNDGWFLLYLDGMMMMSTLMGRWCNRLVSCETPLPLRLVCGSMSS
jgi:hypothetical protein